MTIFKILMQDITKIKVRRRRKKRKGENLFTSSF